MEFPKNFLFGSASSPDQMEGNKSCVRRSDWDVYLQKKPLKNLQTDGIDPDWWTEGVAEEDFKRLKDLGLNTQRLGFEWARIMPEPGEIDNKAIKRYRQMDNYLKSLGMNRIWTLNHFTLPYWVAEFGGWENPKIISEFKKYTEVITQEFGDVEDWITINEPNQIVDMGYILGEWPPGKKFRFDKFPTLLKNLKGAHKSGYEVIKKNVPNSNVGVANAVKLLKPFNPNSFLDRKVTEIASYLENNKLIDLNKDFVDFVGINYYHSYLIKYKPTLRFSIRDDAEGVLKEAPFLETIKPEGFVSDAGWSITPDLFYELLIDIADKYKKPIMITENGVADRNDEIGSFYILSHLIAASCAIERGVDIRGYIYWASINSKEWMIGNKYEFGLLDNGREFKNSAKLYGEIAKSGKINPQDLAQRYLSVEQRTVLDKLFFNIS